MQCNFINNVWANAAAVTADLTDRLSAYQPQIFSFAFVFSFDLSFYIDPCLLFAGVIIVFPSIGMNEYAHTRIDFIIYANFVHNSQGSHTLGSPYLLFLSRMCFLFVSFILLFYGNCCVSTVYDGNKKITNLNERKNTALGRRLQSVGEFMLISVIHYVFFSSCLNQKFRRSYFWPRTH